MVCANRWSIAARTYAGELASWRQPADERALPSFVLRNCGNGTDSATTRKALTELLAGRKFEEVLPNDWTQHLVDVPALDGLSQLQARFPGKQKSTAAAWHVLDVAPLTSWIVGQLGRNGGADGHMQRMHAVAECLRRDVHWHDKQAPRLAALQPPPHGTTPHYLHTRTPAHSHVCPCLWLGRSDG